MVPLNNSDSQDDPKANTIKSCKSYRFIYLFLLLLIRRSQRGKRDDFPVVQPNKCLHILYDIGYYSGEHCTQQHFFTCGKKDYTIDLGWQCYDEFGTNSVNVSKSCSF